MASGEDLREVAVEGHDGSTLFGRQVEDLLIGSPGSTEVADVLHVPPEATEIGGAAAGQALIEKE